MVFNEQKKTSIVWHYRRSDPEFGKWKAEQLLGQLYETVSNMPVEIHMGKKIVEVSSIMINKGNAMRKFASNFNYDLIVCAGDDQTDESMFNSDIDNLLSIKVGEGNTSARFRVKTSEKFKQVLGEALEEIDN